MPADLDFEYEDDTHTYRNTQSGIVRPSVTQTLKIGGVFDYSMVPAELLERKRIIGTNVHAWTAQYDREGSADPTALTEIERGYANGWLKFMADARPRWYKIEEPMLREIYGIEIGGTPDRIGLIANRMWVVDIKCTASNHPGWALQLADYEMMETGMHQVGKIGRMCVRLNPNGTYHKPQPYENPGDAAAAIAFLQATTWLSNHNLLPKGTS